MKLKNGVLGIALVVSALVPAFPRAQAVPQKGDWPMYGRDPAGTRYSPLDQINTTNVTQLRRAWVYHTGERGRAFETTPIVVDNVLYFSTQNQKIVALDAETGTEIWKFDPKSNAREHRGVSYWPGDSQTPPRILFGTGDGRLMALDAKTGTLVAGFGDNGAVDLKAGIIEKFPRASYAISSPPAIYRDVVIVGPATQEGPTFGPSGDPRAYDVRTGKLIWRFHTVPQPGEPGHDTWGPDGWKNRSGPSQWGAATIDTARGTVFLPIGNPADSFYGADRQGTNLYANSIVALDALTGTLRWHYQVVHHDIWDYDLSAPPALIDAKRDGRTIPAVAQITKMGLLFILDRATGRPVFGVEERPVPKPDTPGEAPWPTQPFPVKPPPLARMSITKDDITRRTAAAHRFCSEWFARLRHEGPYTPFGTTPSLLFPGTMGGGNWGGVSFDPTLGYIFVNTSSLGGTGQMVAAKPDAPMPWRNEGGYTRFIDEDGFPCQQPPWGELTAVNAATGDIAWRVPLGSYDEIEAQGLKNAGAANMGGSIVTAGGLVFIGATTDSKFRAFDSRTGKELWITRLDATADAVPMTYQGRNGKQYVVIAAGGTNRFRMLAKTADQTADTLTAFALPDTQSARTNAASGAPGVAQPAMAAPVTTRTAETAKAVVDPPLPDGDGKQLVVRMCTACHGTAVFATLRMDRAAWADEVAAMVERGAEGSEDEIRKVVEYLVRNFGPARGPAVGIDDPSRPPRWFSTFSIVAFDPATNDLGVGVQSRAFTAGAAVPYAIPGVGAVATQAAANRLYGPKAIELLKQGSSPAEVVKRLTDEDPGRDTRQVAVIDAKGRSAVYTGKRVIDRNADVTDFVHLGGYAGHITGQNYSVQGNTLASEDVLKNMARAYEHGKGSMAERLMDALEAGQSAGGDTRGMQSAGLLVVRPVPPGSNVVVDRIVDLRVDDAADPFRELRRLLNISLGVPRTLTDRSAELVKAGKFDDAIALMKQALEVQPTSDTLHYALAQRYAQAERPLQALVPLREAIRLHPNLARQAAADPVFAKMRELAEFKRLVRAAGP